MKQEGLLSLLFMFYLDISCENVSKFHQIKALQFDNTLKVVMWNINNCFNYQNLVKGLHSYILTLEL